MDRFAPAALTLIDGDVSVPIRPLTATAGDPIACTSWDLGAPEVRITSIPRPGTDGVDEGGGYFGARTVSLELRIRGDGAGIAGGHDPYWYINRLAGMCHPARRPTLKIQRADESSAGTAWYLTLRGTPWSLTYERASAAIIGMTLSFSAPDGMLVSDLHTATSGDLNSVIHTDWIFPAAFPHGFGPTAGQPSITVHVAGSAPVNPILYINGPARNPGLVDDLGNKFIFSGLTLYAGQIVRIDMAAGSVLLANTETGFTDTSADVFYTVDFANSSFWSWPVGVRKVSMLADSGSFAVQWRDRQLVV